MKIGHVRNTKNIVSKYFMSFIKDGDVCLDATVGNGNDIAAISKLVGDHGKVYGFDIQNLAIDNTRELLKSQNTLGRTILILDSHENLDKYIRESLDFIIYNLGYLPRGDKRIITNEKSTIISIEKSLKLMRKGSIMLITAYPGHPGGMYENTAVSETLSRLKQKDFNVLKYDFINQKNDPPVLYAVEKL